MERKYRRKPESWWIGREVVTVRAIANDWAALPPGSVCRVTRKWGGLNIKSTPCSRCGLSIMVSRVRYEALQLVSECYMVGLPFAKMRCDMRAESEGREHTVLEHGPGYLVLPVSEALLKQNGKDVVYRNEGHRELKG